MTFSYLKVTAGVTFQIFSISACITVKLAFVCSPILVSPLPILGLLSCLCHIWERSGSVVECLTRDRGVACLLKCD